MNLPHASDVLISHRVFGRGPDRIHVLNDHVGLPVEPTVKMRKQRLPNVPRVRLENVFKDVADNHRAILTMV
jgi:hypothetical protein